MASQTDSRAMSAREVQAADRQRAERSAKRFWVSLVVLLLTLQVVIGGLSITLATGDPSAAIVPNYYEAALNWDATARELKEAERLGWQIHVSASDVADARGMRALSAAFIDSAGAGIADLDIVGTAYHHARGSDVVQLQFESTGDGNYYVLAPLRRSGLWEIDLTCKFGDQPVRIARTLEVE